MRRRRRLPVFVLAPFAGLGLSLPLGCRDRSISISDAPIGVVRETTGRGQPAENGDLVTVDYVLTLPNGEEVLNQSNCEFQLGARTVIEGVDKTVLGMKRGGMREVVLQPHQHWGRKGYGDKIPPKTNLHMTIWLRAIEN